MKRIIFFFFLFSVAYGQNTHVAPTGSPSPSALGSNKHHYARVFNVIDYGAFGDGVEHYVASMSATTTLTCSDCSFTSADVGKVVVVDSAKGSGKPLITTIASFSNSTTVILTAAATATVTAQRVVYGTDDTQAIQAAINACATAIGGTVWIPNGLYIINGALQTSIAGVNPNSQLYIPAATSSRDPARCTITIAGETGPQYIGNDPFNNVTYFPSKKGTVLLSTINGSGAAASMIGSKAPSTSFGNFNYSHFEVKDITLLTQINPNGSGPTVGGINAYYMADFYRSHVRVEVDGIVFNEPAPTADVAGIISPGISSEVMNYGEYNMVIGYRYGFVHSEHDMSNQEEALVCYWGHVFARNNASAYAGRIETQWCTYDVAVPGLAILGSITADTSYFNISQLQVEALTTFVTGKWYNNVKTISDSLNLGRASLLYEITVSGSGYASYTTFSKLGGGNIKAAMIQDPAIPAGSTTQLQYNLNGFAAGSPSLTFDASNRLTIGTGGSPNYNFNIMNSLGAGNTGAHYQNLSSTGQTAHLLENDRGSTLSYMDLIYGGSANAIGNLFGVSRADKGFLIFDGSNNLGGYIGTLVNQPLVLGTNNTARLTIDGSGNFTNAGTTSPGTTVTYDLGTSSLVWRDLYISHPIGKSAIGASSGLGTNVTSVTPTGNDAHFSLTVVTSANVSGTVGLIAFGRTWGATPYCVISSANAATGAMIASAGGYVALNATSTTSLTLAGVFTGAGTWVFNCHCGQ